MRIFIDIGHPAHVHYFRNFIKIMKGKGHQFFISARDKEVTQELLDHYNIKYSNRGKGRKGLLGKFIYLFEADFKILKFALQFKPDLFLSFGSPYAAQVSKLLRKPHIAFDDTEHAKYEHMMYVPFTDCIITPQSFLKSFGNKQIKFNGTMDCAYLHKDYYQFDKKYLSELKLSSERPFFLLRFVSWEASHDVNQNGFSALGKKNLIELLIKHGEVFISSEGRLPESLIKYKYNGDPSKIHTLLKNASIFISESGSMATEAAILGTCSVVVNSSVKYFGVFKLIQSYGNLFCFDSEKEAIEKIISILNTENLKEKGMINSKKYFKDSINLTAFMIWFIENYPASFKKMKDNPDYQYNFR